ncbi:angiopoietin-2a [Polypterus senegalus]
MVPAWLACFLVFTCSVTAEDSSKRRYQIQNGPCSYTFLLPEVDNCYPAAGAQSEEPEDYGDSVHKLEQLEVIMNNNTQWLLKLEAYIQEQLKEDVARVQQQVASNHTPTMSDVGTSLLSHTAEQTRKLRDMEKQVINQTARLQLQLLENTASTAKLEGQVRAQTGEISKLHEKNSFLEKRITEMEATRLAELKILRGEKEQLQELVVRQTTIIGDLEKQLLTATFNKSALQQQQHDMIQTVNSLIQMISDQNARMPAGPDVANVYKDCAEIQKLGKSSGVYSLSLPNSTEEVQAYCDMDTDGGGWTVIQRRQDGKVDFQRTWKEYKEGFGDPAGEHWLGNEFVAQLTNLQPYTLRVQLRDWEGNEAFSLYQNFYLDGEAQNYRIHLKGYSGTAGKISSLSQPGSDFSTKDMDNDKCICKCAQLTTGGWWFDACGPSNLNGLYYRAGQNTNRFNGIKWYYWKGSGYSLQSSTMMIRPASGR